MTPSTTASRPPHAATRASLRRSAQLGAAVVGAVGVTVALASPASASTGSISGSSACRSGYASTSSTFAPDTEVYALTARAVYYGYAGQTLTYSPFVRFGSTYAHFKRSAYSTWANGNVSNVFWVWWEGTPETGLRLLNNIHVDCNT